MEITLTMPLTQESLNKLKILLSDTENTGPEKPSKPLQKALASEETKPEEEPSPKDESITKTDIRAVALKLSKAGKQKELADIFAKFGGKKLSDFDSRPDTYSELMKELVSVNV